MSDTLDHPLRTGLLAWYRRVRRDLPWRRDRDPYRVWISEAMLQQTRVETVVPYYERFLQRFPTVAALAAAPEEDVLAAWSGLGYYRRARALRETARAVVAAGGFPSERAALLALPGIGPYTAGALLSIAFDEPEPLVDGNVARVLGRVLALDAPAGSKELDARLWSAARELVPARGAGEWNQALMELGALVCTPREPRCGACPLRRGCRALSQGRVTELPRRKARPESVDVDLEVLVAVRRDRLLLQRRPPEGRMAGLWQLPAVERGRGEPRLFPRAWPRGLGLAAAEPLGRVRHTITRHRIRAEVVRGRVRARGAGAADLDWFDAGALSGLALTGLTAKVLRAPFFVPLGRAAALQGRDQ